MSVVPAGVAPPTSPHLTGGGPAADPARPAAAAARAVASARRRPERRFLLWVYAVFALLPLLLMVISSLRSNSDLFSDPPAPLATDLRQLRRRVDGRELREVLRQLPRSSPSGRWCSRRSVATLASYALARSRSRIFRWIESLFLSGLMLPIHLAVLPIFYLFDELGLIDSRLGLRPACTRPRASPSRSSCSPRSSGSCRWSSRRRRPSTAPMPGDVLADHGAARAPGRSQRSPSSSSCPSGTTSSSRWYCCATRRSTRCRWA